MKCVMPMKQALIFQTNKKISVTALEFHLDNIPGRKKIFIVKSFVIRTKQISILHNVIRKISFLIVNKFVF